MQQEIKNCQNCKQDFTIEPGDFGFYEKIKVPPPTWCPPCRLKRRLAFRNERTLYKRQCDLCKENIISIYSPKSPYTVYCPKCWHGDGWDPYEYGVEYDPSLDFFEQYIELEKKVPHLSLLQENNINSPWTNYETDDKNCYLNFGGHYNQDSAYNQYVLKSRDSFDNFWILQGEYSYGNTLCEKPYKNFDCTFCFECRDAWFSFDCRNCSNIIGCSGLRHKSYCIFNQQVTKEEFEKFLKDNLNGSRKSFEAIKNQATEYIKTVPQRALFIERSINCSGNLVKESNNCHDAWNVEKSENVSHVMFDLELKDSMDATSVWKSELVYDILAGIYSSNIFFSSHILDKCSEVYYSNLLFSCNDCFGCSHIRHGAYSILNKKYSKEEYIKTKEAIIKNMSEHPYVDKKGRVYKFGEFFPYEVSPFSYEETVANEYFPLSHDEVDIEGLNAFDRAVESNYDVEIVVPPENVHDADETILNKAIRCDETGKLFKLIKMELDFYKRFNLPLPTKSPFARHRNRLRFIAGHMRLINRVCGKCQSNIESVYTENEFPIVYCEKCYQQEVY